MQIKAIIQYLNQFAPLSYQEPYDNAGLLVGNEKWECNGILCSLDVTEAVVQEAINKGCNLIVAHHPIIFSGLKKLVGNSYVERTVITAIKNDIAIFAIHTNLDNMIDGVNAAIANKLGLLNQSILAPKSGILSKLCTYIPESGVESLKNSLFECGAGQIGNYSECSFQVLGKGSFKGNENSNPSIGEPNIRTELNEVKIEFLFPSHLKNKLIETLFRVHPYETVAYEIIKLDNENQYIGSGILANLPEPMDAKQFLKMLQTSFNLTVIRHTQLIERPVQKIAICGGAGSFLLKTAINANADVFVTSDFKYHEFFDAENRLVIADIGHWESEQFTVSLLIDILQAKFPTFAVLKSVTNTNPVHYFL